MQAPDEENQEEPEINNWCNYCKEEITDEDEYVKLKKRIFHVECLETLRGNRRELKFGKGD